MNYMKIFLFCAIVFINGCHIYVRSVESICEHITYKDIDSIEVFSYKEYDYLDTVYIVDKTSIYPPRVGNVTRKEYIYDKKNFVLKKDYVSKYVRDNLFELTDSLLKNCRLSERQSPIFQNDSSVICFYVYFSNTCRLIISSSLYKSFYGLNDVSAISATKRDNNFLESIPYQIPLRGLTIYTRGYGTTTSLYKDIINETFNELAMYYNSIESDSSKHVILFPTPKPTRINFIK